MIEINKDNQEILVGSSKLSSNKNNKFDKTTYMIDHMENNLAFKEYIKLNKISSKDKYEKILKEFTNRYLSYRDNWVNALNVKNKKLPLSVDIEIAAICDLACPHCHREYLVTPDKIINEKLYQNIVDQAVKIGVPSLKLIWRGEPLLHPKLKDLISYAKKSGIIEVIINTNATNLDKKKTNFVSVLVNPNDEILEKIKDLNFDYYQLYDVNPEKTKIIKEKYKVKIITALTIENKNDIEKYKKYQSISEIILFDSKGYENSAGFDHKLLNYVPASINKMLAGNIQYDDKLDKYSKITDIIDISGSLETSGEKDISKIKIFLESISNVKDEN